MCLVRRLGRVRYREALELQRELVSRRIADEIPDTLLLLEHPAVFTLGKRTQDSHIPGGLESLRRLGAEVFSTDRGGSVTYHGPGQIVGYPIVDLKAMRQDVKWYLNSLEETVIRALGDIGITAGRSRNRTGVWVGDRKICAIGVRVERWVASHGFALNVNTDLQPFREIIPCGIPDGGITSVQDVLGRGVEPAALIGPLISNFGNVFERTMVDGGGIETGGPVRYGAGQVGSS